MSHHNHHHPDDLPENESFPQNLPGEESEVQEQETGREKESASREEAAAPEKQSPAPEAAVPEESEVEKLRRELEETRAKLLYLQADYQNYRKRTAKDLTEARIYGAAGVLSPFITVYDFLHMAQAAAEKSDNIESIRQGLTMIIGEYNKAFEETGVRKIETVGKKFDPETAEAVAHEHSDTVADGVVIKEWNGGYKYGERLLRPARVVVSAGPAEPGPDAKNAKE